MKKPAFLEKGQTVSVVAPGRKVSDGQLTFALTILKSWGLNPVSGLSSQSSVSYFSGSDDERLEDLQNALDNSEVSAIFMLRGGYGMTRILDRLDFTTFLKNPKWIIGFSDVTALHLQLEKWGAESVHGIMPIFFSRPEHEESMAQLKALLFGSRDSLSAKPSEANRTGEGQGRLIGGNLSLILDSLATKSTIETEGKILIIEEVDEYFYKVDRMLMQLKRAGKLHQLAGLVIGYMTGIKDSDIPFGETIDEIILSKIEDTTFPVAFHFPIGHDAPNLPWIHGAEARLVVTEQQSSLSYI